MVIWNFEDALLKLGVIRDEIGFNEKNWQQFGY
jgi:hypothetical protein